MRKLTKQDLALMTENDIKVWAQTESRCLGHHIIESFKAMTAWQRCLAWVALLKANREDVSAWYMNHWSPALKMALVEDYGTWLRYDGGHHLTAITEFCN